MYAVLVVLVFFAWFWCDFGKYIASDALFSKFHSKIYCIKENYVRIHGWKSQVFAGEHAIWLEIDYKLEKN